MLSCYSFPTLHAAPGYGILLAVRKARSATCSRTHPRSERSQPRWPSSFRVWCSSPTLRQHPSGKHIPERIAVRSGATSRQTRRSRVLQRVGPIDACSGIPRQRCDGLTPRRARRETMRRFRTMCPLLEWTSSNRRRRSSRSTCCRRRQSPFIVTTDLPLDLHGHRRRSVERVNCRLSCSDRRPDRPLTLEAATLMGLVTLR
jgi:hypothetical protein